MRGLVKQDPGGPTIGGRGVLAIWNDILPASAREFRRWHTKEHMPERLGIPGFRRGRRLFAADSSPPWLTLYEADDAAVFSSGAYLERLNAPTDWARSILPTFRNTERMVGEVCAEAGSGYGGMLLACRIWHTEVSGSSLEPLRAAVDRLVEDGRVGAARLIRATGRSSSTETAEKQLRKADQEAPDAVLLVEFCVGEIGDWALPCHVQAWAAEAERYMVDRYWLEHELDAKGANAGL
jgi:hypothetical protein